MAGSRMRRNWVIAVALLSLISGIGLTTSQAAAPISISIWTYGNVIDPVLVAQYEKLHPGIKIVAKKSDLDGNAQALRYALPSSAVPDIAAIEISYMGEFRNYTQYLTDLSTLTPSASDIKSQYLPWRWNEMVADSGQILGIPTDVGGLAVAYRVDLFKKAGLPTDPVAVSALWPTWDKYIATGKQYVTKQKGKAFLDIAQTIYTAVVNQGNQKYYDDSGNLVYANNPNIQAAFNYTAAASQANLGTNVAQYSPDWNVGLNKGLYATVLAPAWMLEYIKQYAPKTSGLWNIATLPGNAGNQGGSALTIPTHAAHPQEAWSFIRWYTAAAQQKFEFVHNLTFPTITSLYSDPTVGGLKDPFFNNAQIGKIYSASVNAVQPFQLGKKDRLIDSTIGQALSRVQLGKQLPQAAWSQALSDINRAIN
jgi:cellobiose transport system substrate-binding protein